MGIRLSRVRGEEGGCRGLLHNRLLPCLMLWLVGSWGNVTGTSGGCLQTAGEVLPRGFRQCCYPGSSVPSLQPPSGRELRMPGEAVGTAGQGKGKSCRTNSKTLPWRAGKDKKDAHYLDRTVKTCTGEACQLGCDKRRMSCCLWAQPGKSLRNAEC